MSSGKWTASTVNSRRKVVDKAYSVMGNDPLSEKDDLLAGYCGVSAYTAKRWRQHKNVPSIGSMNKIHAFIHEFAGGQAVKQDREATRKVVKQTAHSVTVQAVNALLEHLTLTEMIELSEKVSRRARVLYKERNGS